MKYLALLAVLLTGCAAVPPSGSTSLQTFTQLYVAGVRADDLAVQAGTTALNAGLINSTQAAKVQAITIDIKAALDAANAAYAAGATAAANGKLSSAVAQIAALSVCLTEKGISVATFDACLPAGVTP